MFRQNTTIPIAASRAKPWTRSLPGLFVAAVATTAFAQYAVQQPGQINNQVNTMVGGGYNYSRPYSPMIGGNPYATGNVGRSMSLRSYSPILSTSAFHANLGSDSLSSFIRDSVSTEYAYTPGQGLLATPYYDPSRTAPTVGYLQGYSNFQPTTPVQSVYNQWSGMGSTPGIQSFSQYGAPPVMRSNYDSQAYDRSQLFGQPVDNSLSSSIFGVSPLRSPRPIDSTGVAPNAFYVPPVTFDHWNMPSTANPAEVASDSATTGVQPSTQQPLDLRITAPTPLDGQTPIDVRMHQDAMRMLTEQNPALQNFGTQPQQYARDTASTPGLLPGSGQFPTPAFNPGGDVFADMRKAMEISQNPQAEWYDGMRSAVGVTNPHQTATPTNAVQQQMQAVDAAAEFLSRVFESPVETFAGSDPTLVNQEIRQAEVAMSAGRYYDAANYYERAASVAPANPLPLLGKSHAYLAAGEYVSAATNLLAGLGRFPDISRFRENLTTLMGGGEIVDIRRADLMKMLDRHEDPQLRFLLGYLELNTGMTESGMQNLEKAAETAPPGSIMRRFPDLVRHKLYQTPSRSVAPEAPPAEPDDSAPEKPGENP